MTRRWLGVVAALVAAASIAGCGGIDRGTVVEKSHSDAYSWPSFIIISDGKTTTMVPQINYVPECWGLLLRAGQGEDLAENTVCVDPVEWNATQVGGFYAPKDDDA